MTDDERAIRELVSTWMTASEMGDVDTVLSLMADDVISRRFGGDEKRPYDRNQ